MSHAQSLLFPCLPSSARSTRTPVPTSLFFLSHGDDHCDDPRHGATFGQLAESNTLTGYEPNDLTEMNNTGGTPIFFHRPSVTSTYDSAESTTTPPLKSDLDDEQIRNMLASPLYSQEREAGADRPQVYHSCRETCVSSSSLFRANAGSPAAVFSHKIKSSQESRSDGDGIPLTLRAVQGGEWSTTQTLWIGKWHMINSWRANRSPTFRVKIWSTEARMQSRFSRLFYSWTSKTKSFQSCVYKPWIWNISRREQARLHEELAQKLT